MKIAVIGSPGSGKSTFAQKLHKVTSLPVYHLDQYYWLPGWKRQNDEVFKKAHHALCDKQKWIIEGMSLRNAEYRLDKADEVVFLDVSIWTCLYRVLSRSFKLFGKVNFSSAPGCKEGFPTFEFLYYIVTFHLKQHSRIDQLLKKHSHKRIFVIKNKQDMQTVLMQFNNR